MAYFFPAIQQIIRQEIQQSILPAIQQTIQQEIQQSIQPLVEQSSKAPITFLRKIYSSIYKLKNAALLAAIYHPGVFLKYKGIHKEQDVVIVGAGPTLDEYEPIPDAVHIGVNRTYLKKNVKLDYLFMQDGGKNNETAALTRYRKGKCKRFFGVHPLPYVKLIKDSYATKNEAERYYFDIADPDDKYWVFPSDLAHQPFVSICSTVTVAFQFALWCSPRRIYLVGCDCSHAGYFSEDKMLPQTLNTNGLIKEWSRLAEFARRSYPEIEIISVNPVGLKGMFKDMKMKQKGRPISTRKRISKTNNKAAK